VAGAFDLLRSVSLAAFAPARGRVAKLERLADAAAIAQLVLLESNPFCADGAALATPMRSTGSFASSSDRAVAYAGRR